MESWRKCHVKSPSPHCCTLALLTKTSQLGYFVVGFPGNLCGNSAFQGIKGGENSHSFLAMKLTVCPWKWRSCPFGKALFHGAVVLSVSDYSKWFRAKVFLLIQGSRRTILSRSSSNFLIWFRQRKRWGKQHDIYDIVTHMFICCWLAWSTWKSEQV